jgi:hypothetical protein
MRHSDRSPGGRDLRWWHRGGLLAVLVALLVTTAGIGAASAATLASDDFEDGNAAGWTTTGGTWIVVREDSRVLHQSSLAANALARTGQPGWRDYTVTAQVKPTSFNGMPGFAGVVARAQSTSAYYALVVRPDDTVALLRVIGGTASTLATKRLAVAEDATYTLSLRVDGQRLTGRAGGVELAATDGFLYTGPAGLVTTWTTASFDDVTITDA